MNITYLLGAGASANALPVVSKLNDRLEKFNIYLAGRYDHMPVVRSLSSSILNKIRVHATVDTYAKKLFLQETVDWTTEIDLLNLKYYLSLFFIAEQSKFYENYSTNTQESGGTPTDARGRFYPNRLVDNRYDPFLATLLEKRDGGLFLPEGVNIISWNYDCQIELAYMPFAHCELDQALNILNVVPPKNKIETGSNIIKLNGTAGLITPYNQDIPSNYWGNDYEHFKDDDFELLLQEFIKGDIIANKKNLTKPVLNFAWEKEVNAFSKMAFNAAIEIMSETDILVIIGYTFPNFNRGIDRLLMGECDKLRKIYYQAPKAEINSLIVRLKGLIPEIYYLAKKKLEIIPYTDLGQFCIPYEI